MTAKRRGAPPLGELEDGRVQSVSTFSVLLRIVALVALIVATAIHQAGAKPDDEGDGTRHLAPKTPAPLPKPKPPLPTSK